jgi:exopolysaccharide biosynthesis polyprenyl glycosylphosphotransferase
MKKIELFFGLIRIPADMALALLAFVSAYTVRRYDVDISFVKSPDLESFPPFNDFLQLAAYAAIILFVIFALQHLYSMRVTTTYATEVGKIIVGVSIWLMVIISYYFLIRAFPFSRLVLFYSWLFGILYIALGRGIIHSLQHWFLRMGVGQRRVVLVGSGDITETFERYLKQRRVYNLVATVKTLEDLQLKLKHNHIDEVVQTKRLKHETEEAVLELCRENHAVYHFVPDVVEVARTNIETNTVFGLPLITLKSTPLDGWGRVVKRIFDMSASFFGLLFLLPIFALVAIGIKINSPGPIFFRYLDDGKTKAKRVGHKGKKFCCHKFRTMKVGVHDQRYSDELASKNVRDGTPLVKIKDDPRVTTFGKFLRRYSIDELPQLWNVLKGDMSLVGPRPHLPEEVEKYQRHHKFVLTLPPGITGLAQISGRSDLPFEEEVRLDTYYIENWSLFLDIKILFRTIFVVLRPYKE